jgi:hypothetical protein
MKLSDAAVLCEGNNRAFAEVYKIYNFKDEDDLRAYCDFVIHEPAEWMSGFPSAWKSSTMFSKPRAAFHRLLRAPAVVSELGETYCEQVHGVVWNAFKNHMAGILEKRAGSTVDVEASDTDNESNLTAESIDSAEMLAPVPPVPAAFRRSTPKNAVVYARANPVAAAAPTPEKATLDYKQKYEATHNVLMTLLGAPITEGGDENARLRAALTLLLQEYAAV